MYPKRDTSKIMLALIDLLSLMLAVFIFFYISSLATQKPNKAATQGVEMKAEFLVTLDWDAGVYDDVDMHMLLPDGKSIVGYNAKDKKYAILDHDDMGAIGDTITDANGATKVIPTNREVISIRSIVPGRYVVNARVYRAVDSARELVAPIKLPYEATVTLISLNPNVKEEVKVKLKMTEVGKQLTAFSFVVTPDGKIVSIDKSKEYEFIPAAGSFEESPMPAPPPILSSPIAPQGPKVDRLPGAAPSLKGGA